MLPVGLYEWKIATAHPILAKNILRTLEAEILKYLRTFSPKIRPSYKKNKKRVYLSEPLSGRGKKEGDTKFTTVGAVDQKQRMYLSENVLCHRPVSYSQ